MKYLNSFFSALQLVAIETLQILKLYRKTIQQYACTFALIIMSFMDAISDFHPNDLAYYALTGLAGFTIMQSVRESMNKRSKDESI